MSGLRVKVCGVTTPADARQAALLGADAVGPHFDEGPPRPAPPEGRGALPRGLPPLCEPVALYVNQPLRVVFQELGALGRVRTFQWYGGNRELSDCYPFQMIAAFPVRDNNSLLDITRYLETAEGVGRLPAA